jgi:hypothetical protein
LLGDKQTPLKTVTVQALRISRFAEEIAHGRKSQRDSAGQFVHAPWRKVGVLGARPQYGVIGNHSREGPRLVNAVSLALRRPISTVVAVVAIVLVGLLALARMPRDIFPDLGVPTLYVAQTYGGMDPATNGRIHRQLL